MHIPHLIKQKFTSGLGKDIGITLASQATILLIGLAINKLLSVMLGVEGYGQYSIIKRSTAVISFVMLSGMGIALPRYFSGHIAAKEYSKAKATVLVSIIATAIASIVVIAACLVFKGQLSHIITGGDDKGLYLIALLFAFGITASSLLYAYYRGANAFKNFGISQIAIQVMLIAITVMTGSKLKLMLALWAVATLAYVLIAAIVEGASNKLYKENLSRKDDIVPQFKEITKYGLPRLAGDFFMFSLAAWPLIAINAKLGIEPSSFFATGIMLTTIITPFFTFTGMVLLPHVSASVAKNDFSSTDKLIKQLGLMFVVLSVLATAVLMGGMDFFIKLFFSSEFLPSAGVARILTATILFEAIYLLLRNPIDAVSKFPYNTVNMFVCLLVMVIMFSFCRNVEQYAWVFLGVTVLKGGLSWLAWRNIRNKYQDTRIKI